MAFSFSSRLSFCNILSECFYHIAVMLLGSKFVIRVCAVCFRIVLRLTLPISFVVPSSRFLASCLECSCESMDLATECPSRSISVESVACLACGRPGGSPYVLLSLPRFLARLLWAPLLFFPIPLPVVAPCLLCQCLRSVLCSWGFGLLHLLGVLTSHDYMER